MLKRSECIGVRRAGGGRKKITEKLRFIYATFLQELVIICILKKPLQCAINLPGHLTIINDKHIDFHRSS